MCEQPMTVAEIPLTVFCWPPLIEERSPVAVLRYPPRIACSPKQPALPGRVPAPARLEQPPVTDPSCPEEVLVLPPETDDWLALAVLVSPPVTEDSLPLAVLAEPPVTEARAPLAVFTDPPVTVAIVPFARLLSPPVMLSISPPDALSHTVNSGAEVAVARIRFPQPPVIDANGSWEAFCAPPLTEEPVLRAWLPVPPVTVAN